MAAGRSTAKRSAEVEEVDEDLLLERQWASVNGLDFEFKDNYLPTFNYVPLPWGKMEARAMTASQHQTFETESITYYACVFIADHIEDEL